jgi:arabinogalactan endo-1,4-beta-galactosidase
MNIDTSGQLIISTGPQTRFAKGADVSWLPQMEASGFIFRDINGEPADCLEILKANGMNTIRLRVFVDPSGDPQSGHCSAHETADMAVRAQKLGFRLLIDFHYSDSWADPAKQTKPAAWAHCSFAELESAVYQHTFDVLSLLKECGITPDWVQIGNEIPDGMLWPDGRVSQGSNLAQLINAGYRATKAVASSIKVIVHVDRGNDNQLFRWFFDALQHQGGQFDVIGLSYYPYWLGVDYTQNIADLQHNLLDMVQRYGKEVMVVEVGGEDTSPANTHAMLSAVLGAVRNVPDNKGLGVLYWEPQGAASWSNYKLSCWSNQGYPTEALTAFREDTEKRKIGKDSPILYKERGILQPA